MKTNIKGTQKTKANIFASAKKVEPSKESKISTFPISPELEQQVNQYMAAKAHVKNWETKKEMAEGVIKEKACELYLQEYKKHGRNIGTFKIGTITVSVQDRYIKMDDNIAAIVAENFPGVIENTTEYLFNQEILKKYIDEISEALQNAEGIPAEDIEQLIVAKEIVSVKKGTIDTLAIYGEKMYDLFQAISPIISMR